jgi:hypothetical protein
LAIYNGEKNVWTRKLAGGPRLGGTCVDVWTTNKKTKNDKEKMPSKKKRKIGEKKKEIKKKRKGYYGHFTLYTSEVVLPNVFLKRFQITGESAPPAQP